MGNIVSVGLVCWLTCAHQCGESGTRSSSTVSWGTASIPPVSTLLSSSPLTQIWCLFFFGGFHSSSDPQSRCLGQNVSPGRICWGNWGSARPPSRSLPCGGGGGGVLFLKHDSSSKLVTLILFCQLRSYYSLIESSHQRWWVEINLSIIVKGLWQKWGAQLEDSVSHQFSLLNILAKYPLWPQPPPFLESKGGESCLGKAGRH